MELHNIEKLTEIALINESSAHEGKSKFAEYLVARKHLVEQILEQIRAVQPNLTDHSTKHVEDVLDNAEQLLGEQVKILTGIDLYCLILSILFHDVGNIFDRKEHNRMITEIYDFIMPKNLQNKQEKYIVLKVAEAHCGKSNDGSTDTLKDVEQIAHVGRLPVKLRDIAAILRFADELAEGPQRTSLFMIGNGKFDKESHIFHEYSKISHIVIDKGNNRIAVTINFDIETDDHGSIAVETERRFVDLIKFVCERVKKLNQERQYTKHYSELLSAFKETAVAFRFWINGDLRELGLKKILLNDLVIPGEKNKELWDYDSEYEIDKIVEKLKKCVQSSRFFCVEECDKTQTNIFSWFKRFFR